MQYCCSAPVCGRKNELIGVIQSLINRRADICYTLLQELHSLKIMALMNLPPSMLSISLCFNFLGFSCTDPTKIFSDAKNIRDGNDNIMNGMFVFGDSFVDNGNSNFLETVANADYLPYGMDFPLRPSGRYNNGKTFIDALGDLLNITAFILPFFDPSTKGNHTIIGANYASSGSGILNGTSSTLV